MINKSKLNSLSEIVKLYFSEYPLIKYSKIKEIIKKIKKEPKEYNDITIPLWIKGRARDLANQTLDFVKKNKDVLSYKKNSFNCQEYSNILKFKASLKNLNLLSNEMDKIENIKTTAIKEYILKIIGIIGFSALLLWGSYTDKDFCAFINVCLVIAVIFLIIRMKDVKKIKNGD